jgi:hypothetical protein
VWTERERGSLSRVCWRAPRAPVPGGGPHLRSLSSTSLLSPSAVVTTQCVRMPFLLHAILALSVSVPPRCSSMLGLMSPASRFVSMVPICLRSLLLS